MANLQIQRVLALPGQLAASTMYIVAATETELAKLYFTNNDGTAVRHIIDKDDVAAMIAAAVPESAASADKLSTARTISASGDAEWSVTFDGSADATAVLTLAETGVANGNYAVVTVDKKGRVTAGRALQVSDVPDLPGNKITSAISVDTTGNAATATEAAQAVKLKTPRSINGQAFDGTQDITINAVDATPRIAVSEKGVANGVATLDSNGFVPASQLPSYVDDVVEVANYAALPATGESSKIYVTLDTNFIYRWSGTVYIQIPGGVGLADSAMKLETPRTISATGDGTWTVTFDGTANVTSAFTLKDVTTAQTVSGITTDTKGRVTGMTALVAADIPTLDATKVTSAGSIALVAADW